MKGFYQVLSFDIFSKIILGAGTVLLIRYMSQIEYARYTLALAGASVASQTLSAGFNRIYIVGYQKLNLLGSHGPFLGLQILLIALIGALFYPFRNNFESVYFLVLFLVFAICLSDFAKTFYQRDLNFSAYSSIEVIRSIFFILALALLIVLYNNQISASQVLVLQTATSGMLGVIVLSKTTSFLDVFNVRRAISFIKIVATGEYCYLFGYFFVLSIFAQIDIFMLKAMTNDLTLATYGSAFRYYSLMNMALSAIHTVLLPAVQQVSSRAGLQLILANQRKVGFPFILLVTLGILVSGWVMPLIDMGRYPEAVATFRILAVSSVISFIASPYINLLMRFEKFRFLFVLIACSLLINISLNYLFISHYGSPGAAMATLLAYCLVNGIAFERTRRIVNFQ